MDLLPSWAWMFFLDSQLFPIPPSTAPSPMGFLGPGVDVSRSAPSVFAPRQPGMVTPLHGTADFSLVIH